MKKNAAGEATVLCRISARLHLKLKAAALIEGRGIVDITSGALDCYFDVQSPSYKARLRATEELQARQAEALNALTKGKP